MHKFDLSMEHLTKIEGSASLKLEVEDNKVVSVKFAIDEYKRFFTEAMKGKSPAAIPPHLARICGTCSNAHVMASIEACENALGIIPSPQTRLLRTLTMHGLIIRDHALHLYLFCLPDIFGKDAFLDLDEDDSIQHQLLHDGFDVKSSGNYLATMIAGRSVHATYPVIGGYLHFPDGAAIEEAVEKLKGVREAVLRLIKIFAEAPFHFDRQTKFMAFVPSKSFGYIGDETGGGNKIITSKGEEYGPDQFRSHLEHVVIPYSQASGYTYKGDEYMVGALARLNLAKDKLHPKTKESAKEWLNMFPSTDIFMNNVAQAIEILHSVDESIDILSHNDFNPEPVMKSASTPSRPRLDDNEASPRAERVGIGVIEAPRGTLYHKVVIGPDDVVKAGEVIVPTGQNQINIERDIGILVNSLLEKPEYSAATDPNASAEDLAAVREKISMEIERLIRAYDPCMSCATHFLKVEWHIEA